MKKRTAPRTAIVRFSWLIKLSVIILWPNVKKRYHVLCVFIEIKAKNCPGLVRLEILSDGLAIC